ncbi:histidine kinase N-terminal 7TM domain-containing protein [Halogranum amylolyticum]|uniref:histidine kinase N-terminal 7TM domain-containing protein n=1 Tax=Halogranum amylolyticum TaxID=660520 RepID=UPI000A591127|nr:histidine kinase N-terminal 7TM domain-containing protein [Halogranum amylolyticum]
MLLWTDLAWVGVLAIPVAWLLFSLEYTGRDQYVQLRCVGLLAVVPVVTVVLALTRQYHDLLYVTSVSIGTTGVPVVVEGGVWYWVAAGYTYLLGVGGMIPLLGLLTSDTAPFRGQSVALLVGLVVPWATNLLYLAGVLSIAGVDPTPIAFGVSGVAYLGALTQFRLLGTVPTPNARARRLLFDRMQEGAVVVDSNDNVVDVNDSSLDILGVDSCTVLGAPADEVIPEYDRLPDDGKLSGHLTVDTQFGTRPYDVVVTRINNVRGTPIGRVIRFHDIGEHLRQQQRLEALHRILRHNIRTETNVIHGYVDQFADDADAQIVKRRALRIDEIGRKGREAIELFDTTHGGDRPRSLSSLLDDCLTAARDEHPAATFAYDLLNEDVAVAGVLESVFSNLLENAVVHNPSDDPHVRVSVRRVSDAGRVRVDVADDGPGIDDYELCVLKDGTETPLKHGSGLGLWIVKWGVDAAGGTVGFAANDPTGLVVTVDVPIDEQQ